MRVAAGKAKGTKLRSVPGDTTRPILDRVKESLFDVLRPEIDGTVWLDLFGGTGAVGIEALSQGAKSCIFTDLSIAACEIIKENLAAAKLTEYAEVRRTDAFSYLRNCRKSFDVIYVAPPQYKGLWAEALRTIAERPDLVVPGGKVIAQIDPEEYEVQQLECFVEEQVRRYGRTELVFYRRPGETLS